MRDFFYVTEAALAVDECAFLLAPAGGGQNEMGFLRRVGRREHVLHDEEFQLVERAARPRGINPRMCRVRRDDPETLDPAISDALHDLVVSQRIPGGNFFRRDVEQARNVRAMSGVEKVASAEQARRVGEQPRAHRIALAGDAVRARAGAAEVSGHQGEIDDGLRGARGFVALIDAHGPPETHGLARADGFGEAEKLSDGETRFRGDLVRRELRDELGELGEARRVAFDEFAVGPAFLRDQIRDAVEQSQIGLRAQREMLRGVHRRLGLARIHDDDLGIVFIPQDALPQDRMRDAEIRTDKDEAVRFLEVRVSVGRRVEAKALLVGDVAGGHALARVRVAVQRAHAELPQRSEERHFLRANLSRAEKRHRLRPVLIHQRFELEREHLHRLVPIHGLEQAGFWIAQERLRRAVGRGERRERLPTFRTGHPEVHRVIGGRCEVHRHAGLQMNVQRTTRRAEAADRARGRVRPQTCGDFAETEIAGMQREVLRERAGPLAEQGIFVWSAAHRLDAFRRVGYLSRRDGAQRSFRAGWCGCDF